MRQFFVSLSTKINLNKKSIIKAFFLLLSIILITFLSGAGFTSFAMSSKAKIILYALSFMVFASAFILRIKTSLFQESFKKKKIPIPKPFVFVVLTIIFFTVLSFVFNKEKNVNVNTYISFILIILLTFFILTTFDSLYILKLFKNTLFILLVISIFLYALQYVSKTFFSPLFFTGEKNVYGTFFLLSNETISGLTNSLFFKIRLTSVFWEPSVLGAIIIFALISELYGNFTKFSLVRIVLFIVALFLTKSTAAYILLPFVAVLFVTEKTKNIYLKGGAIILMVITVVVMFLLKDTILDFLTKVFPDVFGKISTQKASASFVTRLEAFATCFRVFLKNPIFGFGGVSARQEYFKIAGSLIDAQTSTFGVLISSFGIAGAIYILAIYAGLILCKKIDSFSKIVLVFLIVLISNVQCQSEILLINILYFMPLALYMPKALEKRNKKIFTETANSTKTVKDLILRKNDNGEVSRNVIGSFILKGVAILVAFFTIPVYLRYFNNNNSTYGIWVAITSILSVVTVFDFGMGNGLKNKLIQNISNKDDRLSKIYISTTYMFTAIIGLLIFVIFSILIFTIRDEYLLTVFFNGQNASEVDLLTFRIGVSIILLAIGSQFFMKNINYVLQAHQKNAITGIFMVITNGSLMLFALVFANIIPIKQKIVFLAVAYFVFLIVPLLVASIVLYCTKFKKIRPSFRCIDFKESRMIINISFKFFVVQIANLFLWSLNEFFILFIFNFQSNLVTEYTEYYKLFSLLPIILGTVIQQPIWTALAKAETEKNKKQIKVYLIFLFVVTATFILCNTMLAIGLPLVFDMWLGSNAPSITATKITAFVAYSIVYLTSVMLVIIMNAMSLFKTQIISAIFGIFFKIPLIIMLTKVFNLNLGWEIVIFVNIICYLPTFLFGALEIILHLKKTKLLWRNQDEKA